MLNKSKGNFFNFLGNLCYRLNGGLDRLHNQSLLDRLALTFWSLSYGYFDKETAKEFSKLNLI